MDEYPFLPRRVGPPRRRPGALVLAGGPALVAAVVLAGVLLLKSKTGAGEVVVEINEPGALVFVDGEKIDVPGDGKPIKVPVSEGPHELTVEKDGFETVTREFTCRKGEMPPIQVTLVRKQGPRPAQPPEARALARLRQEIDRLAPEERGDAAIRNRLLAFHREHRARPAGVEAAGLMARLAWPADALKRDGIPAAERAAVAGGLADQPPPGLVTLFGSARMRVWEPVHTLAFHPEGKLLAASGDHFGRIWDARTGELAATVEQPHPFSRALAFSPDGKTLAFGSTDATVEIWDVATRKVRHTLQKGGGWWVTSISFSGDSKTVAYGGYYPTRICDVTTGKLLAEMEGSKTVTTTSLAFSADGKRFASVGEDWTLTWWDVPPAGEPWGKPATEPIEKHWRGSCRLAFHPDGKTVAVAAGGVKLFDLTTRQWRCPMNANLVDSLAFNSDGSLLATGGDAGEAKLWEVATGKEVRSLPGHTGQVRVAFSKDGRRLATADQVVRLWEAPSWTERPPPPGHDASVFATACSPDGQLLASAGGDGVVKLWELGTGKLHKVLAGHQAAVHAVAFSPDGKRLVSAGDDRTVRLWDPAAGTHLRTLTGHAARVFSVAFSPDGKTIASGGEDRTVRLWTGADQGRELAGHTEAVNAVAFSPDGKTLASAGDDTTIRLWDVSTGKGPRSLKGHTKKVTAVAFSPDSQTLVSGDEEGTVRLWDVQKGWQRHMVDEHKQPILSVAFSPDGTTLASSAADGAVRLWSAADLVLRETFRLGPAWPRWPNRGTIRQVVFTPEGRHLATANGNGTVYLLRLVPLGGGARPVLQPPAP